MTSSVMELEKDFGYVKNTLIMGLALVFVSHMNVNAFPTVTAWIQSFHDVLSGMIRRFYPLTTLFRLIY